MEKAERIQEISDILITFLSAQISPQKKISSSQYLEIEKLATELLERCVKLMNPDLILDEQEEELILSFLCDRIDDWRQNALHMVDS